MEVEALLCLNEAVIRTHKLRAGFSLGLDDMEGDLSPPPIWGGQV